MTFTRKGEDYRAFIFFISPVISIDPSTLDASERPCLGKGLYIYMFLYIHLNKQVPVRCQEDEVMLGRRGTTKNNENCTRSVFLDTLVNLDTKARPRPRPFP